ncbi:DNA repair-scaffolding protein [Echinops telfairi]|uniref:DNA repair-scaffolding protein n=1 Tax=Echinops telfairi TaxID=9371 RepID=A0AC55D6T7_ECHTE|nr:DNA repair-scaffolding protein [Echinops telfairi]
MSHGGHASGGKRKRNWDVEYPFLPREGPVRSRDAQLGTVGAAASLSEAWLKCGEGFQDSFGTPVLTAEKKTIAEKHPELSPRPKEGNFTSNNANEPTEIIWSSSGSDQSHEEKPISNSPNDNRQYSRIDRFCNRRSLCLEDGASEDELQFIDWEIDSDRDDANGSDEFKEGESTVEISDCASGASSCSLTREERLSELPQISSTEILEYSSDSGKEEDSDDVLFIDSESPHKNHVDFGSDGRQMMERTAERGVKSAETRLCTPQKQISTFPRTPEDSVKKKRPIRGGLAERLSELQNRERSAISFWRHQCSSYQRRHEGRKAGVLIVKILELHEECSLQVAMCEQLEGLKPDSPSPGVSPGPRPFLKVLFTKETASYLKGRPQDIVHIYPPWQKLVIPDGSCPVILNTYFCQKVLAKEDSETTGMLQRQDSSLLRRSTSLARMFRLKDLTPEVQLSYSYLILRSLDLHVKIGWDENRPRY